MSTSACLPGQPGRDRIAAGRSGSIFASGLEYAGAGPAALGWTLLAVVLAAAGSWLASNRPWRRGGQPATVPAGSPGPRAGPAGDARAG